MMRPFFDEFSIFSTLCYVRNKKKMLWGVFLVLLGVHGTLAVPVPPTAVRAVLVGASNASIASVSIAYRNDGENVVRSSSFRGFNVGIAAYLVHDWNLFYAVGQPNASDSSAASIASSADGRSWTSLPNPSCPVGTSMAFGRGRLLVGCSATFQTIFYAQEIITVSVTPNPLVVLSNPTDTVATLTANASSVFGAVRAIAYSEILLRFVAVGITASNQPVIGYSDDGLAWNAATVGIGVRQNFLATFVTDVAYVEKAGWVVSTANTTNLTSTAGLILVSRLGETFLKVGGANSGNQIASVLYSNSAERWFSFSLNPPPVTIRKRAAAAVIQNLISSDTLDLAGVEAPQIPLGGEPLRSIAVGRFLPLTDTIYVGGVNAVASAPATAPTFNVTIACPGGPCTAAAVNVFSGRQVGQPGVGGPAENNLNQTGNLIIVYGVASYQIVLRNTNVANSGTVNGTIVVQAGQSLTVSAALNVAKPQTFYHQLASINSYGGTIALSANSLVTCGTNVQLGPGSTLSATRGQRLEISENLVISGSDVKLVIDPVIEFNRTTSVVMVVANYSRVNGRFASVALAAGVQRRSAVTSANGYTCVSEFGQPQPDYGSQSLTVTIAVNTTCSESGGLSTGAIVGIAVGAAVGGAALAVGIVLVVKYLTASHTATANEALKMQHMASLK